MNIAPLPFDEEDRLEALKRYNILDTLPEQEYDDLTAIASAICDTPIALISLVDQERQWFKAKLGLDALETPRDVAFCSHAILQNKVFIVADAEKDPRFADNPLTLSSPHVRFYAGAPLRTPSGQKLGTICVIDNVPRQLNERQIHSLEALARQVVTQFELKLRLAIEREYFDILALEKNYLKSERDRINNEERSTRATADKLKMVLDNVPAGIIQLNSKLEIIDANPAYINWLGYSRAELQKMTVFDLTHPDDLQRTKEAAKTAPLAGYSLTRFQKRYVTKSGEVVWGQVTCKAYQLADSEEVTLLSVIEDITELKNFEAESKKAEAQINRHKMELDQFFDLSQDLLCFIDTSGRFKDLNPSFQKDLGFTKADLLSKPFLDFIHPEDLQKTKKALAKLSRGAPTAAYKNRCKTAGGDYLAFSWHATLTPEGELHAIGRNITKEAELEKSLVLAREEAEAAAVTKAKILANMSHEIRTPLNGIIGTTSLLRDVELPQDIRDMVDTIQGCSDALLSLVDDILDLSKIEAGKLELENRAVDLDQCLRDAMRIVSPRVREKFLKISYHIDDDVPAFFIGDYVRLRQILLNLLSNAVKFTDVGAISIRVAKQKSALGAPELKFSVKDAGIGMTTEEQAKLFVSFSQVDESTTRKYGGTGLGLAICKRLCEIMGGSIWVESAPQDGSQFHFTIKAPTSTPEMENAVRKERKISDFSQLAARNPLQILAAEDTRVNREVISKFLKKLGYDADVVENGADAVSACEKKNYDVILMDGHMPIMDGFEATRQIRAKQSRQPRIIALTASALSAERQHCFDAGMDDFLQKPLVLEDLATALERSKRIVSEIKAESKLSGTNMTYAGILKKFHGDEEILNSVAAIFLSDCDESILRITNAIEQHNVAATELAVHAFKGAASSFSESLVTKVAAQMEAAAKGNDLALVKTLIPKLIAEAESLKGELQAIIVSRSAA